MFFFKEERSVAVMVDVDVEVDVNGGGGGGGGVGVAIVVVVAVVTVAGIEMPADPGVAVIVVALDFSTLPWLSLRNGGGSHFLPLKPRLLFPGELVFVPVLPSLAITFSASSGSRGATTF